MTRILVADDARDIREVLVDILSDAGYEVVEAKNGGEAFEIARDTHVDLILLDVSMPVMDGFEVLRKITETPTIKATPVVMVTAMPAIKGELAAGRLNSRHYITKPFGCEQVELAVQIALREAETDADEVIDGHLSVTGQGSARRPDGIQRPGTSENHQDRVPAAGSDTEWRPTPRVVNPDSVVRAIDLDGRQPK